MTGHLELLGVIFWQFPKSNSEENNGERSGKFSPQVDSVGSFCVIYTVHK